MYYTTGFSRDEIAELCTMILEVTPREKRTWPPILGMFKSMAVTLSYLRRNRVQAELAECHGVSQSTVSRAITTIVPLLGAVLSKYVPTADELSANEVYIIDGTLLPCWSWASEPGLYSGKHKTTGMNVQVVCNMYGQLAWISDAIEGRHHDSFCLDESEVLRDRDPQNWIGDRGYVGHDMDTPIKKPACRDLLGWEKEFNTQVNKIRYRIEQVIANFKTWRILHTDYRRPISTFAETISTVIALHFYTLAE